jgi:hypothetical protein
MSLSDKEKIALLQFLDQQTMQGLLGGGDSGYGDTLARVQALGGDAVTAAQDFLSDVESGLPYQQVKKDFESAVSKGIYNLDVDTADEVSKSVLSALTEKQKGGGTSSFVTAAKNLGFPELAFLAPSMGKQSQGLVNPYSAPSEKGQKYLTDIETLKSQKLKETGGNSFLRNALKIGGTVVGGAAAGLAAAALPATLPLMIGAGIAAGGLGSVTAGGVLDRIIPDSSNLKDKKKAQQAALMRLQGSYDTEQALQTGRSTGWQKGYEKTIKGAGGLSSPYDVQKLQLMSLLNKQG